MAKSYFLKSLSCIGFLTLGGLVQPQLMAAPTPSVTNGDGSSVQIRPDGSKLIQNSDGSSVQIDRDGSKTIKKEDGSVVQIKPDGTKIFNKL